MTKTITINRSNWTGKTTKVTFSRRDDEIMLTLDHLPGETFYIRRTEDSNIHMDGEHLTIIHEGRPLGGGYRFASDDHVMLTASGIEREASGEDADVIAAAELICNVL